MILIKSHGLGNDYLVAHHLSRPLTAALVVALCDRHTGIGGDGILEPSSADGADYGLLIWNPDGSLAEKSGNGLRIYARYLVDHCDAPPEFTVSIPAGVVRCRVEADAVTVEMGHATFIPEQIPCLQPLLRAPLQIGEDMLPLTAVGVGNPHCVIFFPDETDLDALPWRKWGAILERHPLFPNRTNVQFARRLAAQAVEIRIWERGAGETSASGSSSCATAAAAIRLGLAEHGPLTLVMPGGTLDVHVHSDWQLTLRGPVEEIGQASVSARWLQTRRG